MYDFAKAVSQPYLLLLLLMGAALFYAWRKKQLKRGTFLVLAGSWAGIVVLSSSPFAGFLINRLKQQHPPPETLPTDIDAIVVLGGGIDPPGRFRQTPDLDGTSFSRCQHAAAVYDYLGGRKVVVCGGPSWRVPGGPSVAEVMRDALFRWGLDRQDVFVEPESQSTYENAVNAAAILQRNKLNKILLITDSRHMPRAVLCFRKQGVDLTPLPCDYDPNVRPIALHELLVPSPSALKTSHKAIYEWLGMIWYRIHGRI